MFFNIVIFFIILIILTLILYNSKEFRESFVDLPASHNDFVKTSQVRFNELTNTVNLTTPSLPLSPENSKDFEKALTGLNALPSQNSFKMQDKNQYPIPSDTPDIIKRARACEAKAAVCGSFDDPKFAADCGMSFDREGLSLDGKNHIGGLFITPDQKKKQNEKAQRVLDYREAPFDPYKVYQPTLGKAKPGTFALNKDQCRIVKERVDCETKQTFRSPNCTQCYSTQVFSRVGPESPRIAATLHIFGNGRVYAYTPPIYTYWWWWWSWWSRRRYDYGLINLSETTLMPRQSRQIHIPGNAEGTDFIIDVRMQWWYWGTLPYICGYLEGRTGRGNFRIDLRNLIRSDTNTGGRPRINGTTTVNGFRCTNIVPGHWQSSMRLSCTIPFTFINPTDINILPCDNSPIITRESSATFLESDPCFGRNNAPGNYALQCLQNRWLELGGTREGTGFPSTQEKANALQRGPNGVPLDINNIVDTLDVKIRQALTGLDSGGRPLSVDNWNQLSMWATGKKVNTPCDGPTKDRGPLTKECLEYLYLNKGVNSHIGPTYTLQQSQIASMKGQDTPNTYCQPGTDIDPNTSQGLQFAQRLGGINAVKQTYDQINRLANDNTKTNEQRAKAVKQCYGVTLNERTGAKEVGPTQVFAAAGPGGQSYKYTKSQAEGICAKYGAKVASTQQVKDAQKNGADWCFTGWVSDSNGAIYPITTRTGPGCGNGRNGVMNYTPPDGKAGVNCYGPKPTIDSYETSEILPFSESDWNQPDSSKTRYNIIPNGYLEGPNASCFSGLTAEQAQTTCNNLGNKCAGFSYAKNDGRNGCFKTNFNEGMNNNSQYVGYIKLPQS